MSTTDKVKNPETCFGPNRALWSSLTSLQAENSQLKVKIHSLERKSEGEVSLSGGSPSKFIRMELEREKAEAALLRQQLDAAEAQCAVGKAELSSLRSQLEEMQRQLQQRDEELALKEVELLAALAESEAKQVELLTSSALHNAEAAALRDQLLAAQHYAENLQSSHEADSRTKDLSLADTHAKLATAKAELEAMAGKASRQQGEAISLQEQLTLSRDTTHKLEVQLRGTKGQLQYTEAELRTVLAAAEAAQTEMQELRASHSALEAGLTAQIATLEAACQEHCATITRLEGELERGAAAALHTGGDNTREGAAPSSPGSLGPGIEGARYSGGTSAESPSVEQRCCGAPESSTVYNVMIPSPEAEPCGRSEEETKLTQQVLSLQDKLGALQQAHEVLLSDYGSVTEQLAARQAEVQLARLSPESTQLKNQVQQLQEQVLALQQELFASRSFSQLQGGMMYPQEGGKGLKRSLSRAASTIGQRMALLRCQKPAATSLGLLTPDSRDTSMTESVASYCNSRCHSACTSPGASPFTNPSLSPFALGLGSPGEVHHRGKLEGEVLALRQQLADREALTGQLQQRLEAEDAQRGQLQEALMQQGEELAQAREDLARKQAELEVAAKLAQQLTDTQSVATEVQLPCHAGDHSKCREAADTLFKQLWRERLARQKAESALEQQQQQHHSLSRRSTVSDVDEATLSALQAEAQANDALAVELQRARGHQLQLQQRLEALQLQLAKQNAVLESVRGSPQRVQRPCPPSKDAFAQHSLLKFTEERTKEAELKLAAKERAVAQLKRRERELHQTISQAAELRKGSEKQLEEAREAWRRRLAQERWEKDKVQGQLHATALAHQELLGGLEVLQALLMKTEDAVEGSPASTRTQQAAGTTGRRRRRRSSSTTQEALRQISGLLRMASTRLQALSPCAQGGAGGGGLISPRQEHRALSVTAQGIDGQEGLHAPPAWHSTSTRRLSELVEPASPRVAVSGGEKVGQEAVPKAPQQATGREAAASTGRSASGVPPCTAPEDLDEEVKTTSGEQDVDPDVEGAHDCTAGGSSRGAAQQATASEQPKGQQSSAVAWGSTAASTLLQLANSEGSVPGLPEGSRLSVKGCPSTSSGLLSAMASEGNSSAGPGEPSGRQLGGRARSEAGAARHVRGWSLSSIGSQDEVYLGEKGEGWEDPTDNIPAHMAAPAKEGSTKKASLSAPASSVKLAGGGGKQLLEVADRAGSASPRSPRIKVLADKISSGLKRMGVGCGETRTRSGSSTPAGRLAPERGVQAGRGGTPLQRSTSPMKPRRIWL